MKLFSSGIDTSLAEPFLGCRRGLTITHLCRSRGNAVARLRARSPLPFKSRNTARSRARRIVCRRRQAFLTLIFLYDFRMWHRLACVVIIAALAPEPASAQESPAQFYRGKQITVIVGSSAGGGYDIYARLLARHMPKH